MLKGVQGRNRISGRTEDRMQPATAQRLGTAQPAPSISDSELRIPSDISLAVSEYPNPI